MKGSAFISALIFGILVMSLTWLLVKTHSGQQTGRYQDVLKTVQLLRHDFVVLNQEEYKIQAGVKKDYDKLGDMTNNILRYSRRLKQESTANPEASNDAAVRLADQLHAAVTKKIQLSDRFIEKHAIIRNSLDYFPTLSMQIASEISAPEILVGVNQLEKVITYYIFSNDSAWYAKTIDFIGQLSRSPAITNSRQGVHFRNFLAHANHIVEGKRELNLALNEANNFTVLRLLDAIQANYEEKLLNAEMLTGRYRNLMYLVSVMLVGLIAYMTILWSRNALALWGERQKAHITLASIGDGVIVTGKEGEVQYLNPVAERLTGWQSHECQGKPLENIFRVHDEKSRISINERIHRCLTENRVVERGRNTILVTRTGQEINIEHSAAPINDKQKRVNGAIIVFSDISETRRMSRAIEWQATHDMLTGLVNRIEFENRLNESLITAKQDEEEHSLLYIDLDQFKIVNDTCGHLAGDELLKQVVNLIKRHLRHGDTFARLGGDEFGILLPYCHLHCAKGVSESLLAILQQFRFLWGGKSFRIGASIGIVPVTAEWQDITTILSAADVACYSAKEEGRNRIHIYEESDEELARRKNEMQWVSRILDALNENQIQVYSQSIIPLQESSSLLRFDEILIRLVDDDGGIIMPGAFIPAAERYKLMPMVDRWVIQKVFQYYATCHNAASPDAMLSINLSGSSLSQAQIVDYINTTMCRFNVDPRRICFEITETEAIANLSETSYIITALRKLGFRFALDDFGAGMASFSYLKSLPVDYIKIDGHIILDILNDDVSRLMVEMIVQLAKAMNIITVAEFVESETLLAVLREIDIDYAQGFACGMPKSHCDIEVPALNAKRTAG